MPRTTAALIVSVLAGFGSVPTHAGSSSKGVEPGPRAHVRPVSPGTAESEKTSWDEFEARALEAHGDLGARAARFLRVHRPEADAELDADLLFTNLDLAFRARANFPWAAGVSEEMFFNDVLPYAVFDETREDWRSSFYDSCRSIVEGAETAEDAIQALNREFFNVINVHYNTGRKAPNQSPSESVAQGRATCTGLSIILVNACRAVGIPARGVGVASWHDKRGNHTWVEAWDGTRWRFTGADEYNKNGLDRGWFKGDASKAVAGDPIHAVWATSWRATGRHFPMVWDMESRSVPGVDVTGRYMRPEGLSRQPEAADGVTTFVRAWDGETRIGARVRVIDSAGRSFAELATKAGTSDLNDMPSVVLVPGQAYLFELDHDGSVYTMTRGVPGKPGAETLELRIDEMARSLSREEAESSVGDAWRAHVGSYEPADGEHVVWGDKQLRYKVRRFGDAPEGERSLWISMHGGGGAPSEVNDQQWENQIGLYEPEEGFYVAPRAPTDTWNLWHRGHVDHLFDALIERFVIEQGVDPDRVYLMGYSAGGDGVYQLAPRMADRFASAAMMAGHPNETTPDGLRNLPFALFMGGKDAAYDRNVIAERWGETLAGLAEADPGGYTHMVRIYPEHGHWMQREDREALPWMIGHTRDVWPDKIVWKQDDKTHSRFYWIGVPEGHEKGRAVMNAAVNGQVVDVSTEDVNAVTLYLRDGLVNLDKPVTVRVNGTSLFTGRVHRTEDAVARSLGLRADPIAAATAILELEW